MNQQEYTERYSHDDNAHIEAWRETKLFRPFRFEDLYGAPDPKIGSNGDSWGPLYPNLSGVDKWRKLNRKRDLTDDETR